MCFIIRCQCKEKLGNDHYRGLKKFKEAVMFNHVFVSTNFHYIFVSYFPYQSIYYICIMVFWEVFCKLGVDRIKCTSFYSSGHDSLVILQY